MARSPQKVAVGVVVREGYRRVVVDIDDDNFELIRQRAIRDGTSFGEQVRTLVQWGLDSAEENEITFEECQMEVRL